DYPDTAAVGEVGDAQYGLRIMGEYTAGDDLMHMCYAFDFLSPDGLNGVRVAQTLTEFSDQAPDGWSCWAFSNHDVVRHASRWGLSDAAIRAHTALVLSLRGSVCLYQGEELGLTEADVPFEALQDPYGKEFWPKFKGRDGCRTPMVWSSETSNGGFSQGTPWLPVASEHLSKSASAQENAPGSLLNFYRQALRFRRAHPVLSKGSLTLVSATDATIAFLRETQGARLFCAINLSDSPQQVELPQGAWEPLPALEFDVTVEGSVATLPPYAAFFAKPA
ncbi:MAG: DUF3459 domain-containing protein, partial [Pseudomonadota bacterium]